MAPDYSKRFQLSPREQDVPSLVIEGRRNKEIAATLGIAERTAEHHLDNLLQKLGARNRTEAAALALKSGLVQFGNGIGTSANERKSLLA